MKLSDETKSSLMANFDKYVNGSSYVGSRRIAELFLDYVDVPDGVDVHVMAGPLDIVYDRAITASTLMLGSPCSYDTVYDLARRYSDFITNYLIITLQTGKFVWAVYQPPFGDADCIRIRHAIVHIDQ